MKLDYRTAPPRERQRQGCLSLGVTCIFVLGLIGGLLGFAVGNWWFAVPTSAVCILLLTHQYRAYGR